MTMDTTPNPKDTTPNPKDTTPKGGEPTPKGKEPTPKETPQTYSSEEVERILQLDRMKAGRDWKALETERDNFKSQLATKETEIQDITDNIAKLKTQIDDLASDDPEKLNLVKKLREAEEEKKQAKVERTTLEADKQVYGERIKKAEDLEIEVKILEIVEDYESADADKLSDICITLNANSEEQIRKVADTLWTKKTPEPAEPATPPVKPYSGITSGGSDNLGSMPPKERLKEADRRLREK